MWIILAKKIATETSGNVPEGCSCRTTETTSSVFKSRDVSVFCVVFLYSCGHFSVVEGLDLESLFREAYAGGIFC